MQTMFERMFTAVFGSTGSKFISDLNRTTDRLYDFVYVKVFGLPFIVLGARQTGKTTLIEWMKHNLSDIEGFDPAPTAPGGDSVGTFSTKLGGESIRVKPTRDVGGEYEMWETDWLELFREARPRGVIFMIDHSDVLNHKDALNFVMNMIDEEVEAKRNLKAFVLFVNKSDLWGERHTLDDVLKDYSNEVKRLKNQATRVGYETWIVGGSLKDGANITQTLREFFNKIRPQPR